MRKKLVVLGVLAGVAAALVVGVGSAGAGGKTPPSIKIVGVTPLKNGFALQVVVRNFKMAPNQIGKTKRFNQGHYHIETQVVNPDGEALQLDPKTKEWSPVDPDDKIPDWTYVGLSANGGKVILRNDGTVADEIPGRSRTDKKLFPALLESIPDFDPTTWKFNVRVLLANNDHSPIMRKDAVTGVRGPVVGNATLGPYGLKVS